jgi:hypothetical protein
VIPTTYADLVPGPDVAVRPDEAARFDAALEAAAVRLGIDLATVPPLPRLRVNLCPPSQIRDLAQRYQPRNVARTAYVLAIGSSQGRTDGHRRVLRAAVAAGRTVSGAAT